MPYYSKAYRQLSLLFLFCIYETGITSVFFFFFNVCHEHSLNILHEYDFK